MHVCDICKQQSPVLYRLICDPEAGYDASKSNPLYACETCSRKKIKEIQERGIPIKDFDEIFVVRRINDKC